MPLYLLVYWQWVDLSALVPAKEEEASREVETFRCSQQPSDCHPLAEANDDARVLVLVQLPDNPIEYFILGVAKHRIFLRDADIGLFCQLPESLDPALAVVFCNDLGNYVIPWRRVKVKVKGKVPCA